MTRWRLTVEYDGGAFVGWQRQTNGQSVQGTLETAIERFCGERPAVQGAGRTDAGVHALAQVAHLDIARDVTAKAMRDAVNHHVQPWPVAVITAEPVADDFDARRSAIGRRYIYRILNRRSPPVLARGRVWHVSAPLDADAMHAAAQVLVGHHDFSSFRAAECQAASPVKTLDRLDVVRSGDEIALHVAARSFLHHQVRIFAGTLKRVGEGKWTAGHVAAALAARRRGSAGPTAPPDGLYLAEVRYPPR